VYEEHEEGTMVFDTMMEQLKDSHDYMYSPEVRHDELFVEHQQLLTQQQLTVLTIGQLQRHHWIQIDSP
jgi:hypothetical protein